MYEFTLKEAGVKRNQVTAFHIIASLLLIIMGFITLVTPFSLNIYLAGKANTNKVAFGWVNVAGAVFMLIGIAILVVSIFFNKKVIREQKNLYIRIIEIICFSLILTYCLVQKWYLPSVYSGAALLGIILAYFIEHSSVKKKKIILDERGVLLQSGIRESRWSWPEIERFILKLNVITLKTTSDRMYQFIILDNHSNNISMVNEKAASLIEEHIPKRRKDDW